MSAVNAHMRPAKPGLDVAQEILIPDAVGRRVELLAQTFGQGIDVALDVLEVLRGTPADDLIGFAKAELPRECDQHFGGAKFTLTDVAPGRIVTNASNAASFAASIPASSASSDRPQVRQPFAGRSSKTVISIVFAPLKVSLN